MSEVKSLVFEPENKSCAIDLDVLDRTLRFEDGGGKMPSTAPIQHADLIKKVFEMSHKHLNNFEPKLSPIIIKQANCKRIMWKGPQDECPVENYAIERMVCKIGYKGSTLFEDKPDAKGNMAVGISYNEKGIQVAFGLNVNVCQNLNVFGDNMFSTYGSGKIPFDKGLQLMEHWLQNFDEKREMNRINIQTLMDRTITEKERLQIFGKIYELAIRKNAGGDVDAPLNVTECNKMVTAGFDNITNNKPVTAWDLTNWATSVLKPETSDMINLLEKNNKLNNFLLREFGAKVSEN